MIGKVDHDDLVEFVLKRTGVSDPGVRQGPAYGEDAAAIEIGDRILVVSTDPLSLAASDVGKLAMNVVCNDIAASGADPRWVTSSIFLPDDDQSVLDTITKQIDGMATSIDVAIVGGHTEYLPTLSRPLLSMTSIGYADRFVPTGGACPGDVVLLTKGAAIEATAILAEDFPDFVRDIPDSVLDKARDCIDEISVIPEARIIRESATAMHDPTEGGVLTGLIDIAIASDLRLDIDRDSIPIRPETRSLCSAVSIDPLETFGSGALIATIPPGDEDAMHQALSRASIPVSTIGRVSRGPVPGVRLGSTEYRSPVRDAMYDMWEIE